MTDCSICGSDLHNDGTHDACRLPEPPAPQEPERIVLHRWIGPPHAFSDAWSLWHEYKGHFPDPENWEHFEVVPAAAYDALKRDKDATQEKYRAYRDQIDMLQRDLAAAREREAPLCAPHARLYKKNLSGFFRGACYACAVNARAELEAPDAD